MTKKYGNRYKFCRITSILLEILPVLIFTIMAFVNGEVHEKVTFGIILMVCGILCAINFIFKYKIRSVLWLIMLGIYMCLNNIQIVLLVVALCTIIDEFIFEPLAKKYKNLYVINKEIDKR